MSVGRVVSACVQKEGYVMLAVLVAVAIAAAAASTLFGLVWAVDSNAAADGAHERAESAARSVLVGLADQLVWGGMDELWHGATEADELTGIDGVAVCGSARRVAGEGDAERFRLTATARAGLAREEASCAVSVRPVAIPLGLTVDGDLTVRAALTLDGCGAYVAGDVLGRELIAVPAGADGAVPDRARADRWSSAGVHAGGHIYDQSGEVHLHASAASDTDSCTGDNDVATPQWPLDDAMLAVLKAHGVEKECAPPANVVSLAEVDTGVSAAGAPQTGAVVLLHGEGSTVTLGGWRDLSATAPQATVVVLGDAVLAASGDTGKDAGAAVSGALLVTGTLTIRTPTVVLGGLAAGHLLIDAPTTVLVPPGWADAPPPGAWTAIPVAASEEAR